MFEACQRLCQVMFGTYLELGFDHISDLKGYDHILFIIALCSMYLLSDWKKVIVLVTAFTIGHSITLALSALDIVTMPAVLIEVLIPVTILITAIQNIMWKPDLKVHPVRLYVLPLFFGFIHGMGFSNFFKSLLGQESQIVLPLFAFNLGVEIGQIIIVLIILAISTLVVKVMTMPHRIWNWILSGLAIALSIQMIWERVAEM